MTTADKYIETSVAQYPHLDAKYFAYYMGRNAGHHGGKCELTDPMLRREWGIGYREVKREDALDQDTEWNQDN